MYENELIVDGVTYVIDDDDPDNPVIEVHYPNGDVRILGITSPDIPQEVHKRLIELNG